MEGGFNNQQISQFYAKMAQLEQELLISSPKDWKKIIHRSRLQMS